MAHSSGVQFHDLFGFNWRSLRATGAAILVLGTIFGVVLSWLGGMNQARRAEWLIQRSPQERAHIEMVRETLKGELPRHTLIEYDTGLLVLFVGKRHDGAIQLEGLQSRTGVVELLHREQFMAQLVRFIKPDDPDYQQFKDKYYRMRRQVF